MSFLSKKENSDNKKQLISRNDAKTLFAFNTNHFTFSSYSNQTVLKTSKLEVSKHLLPLEDISLSQSYLLNYKTNNEYLGFKASVVDFFTDDAITSFSSNNYFENDTDLINLPKAKKITTPISTCITQRRSCRSFTKESMPIQDLANILYYACGVSGEVTLKEKNNKTIQLRNCPSGGGLYPITLYFYAHNIETLTDGLYTYLPYNNAISKHPNIGTKNVRDFAEYSFINAEDSNIILIYVYDYIKNTRKYGNQATSYAFIETGEISQNVQLVSTGLDYGCLDIGGYNKEYLQDLLYLDGQLKHVIHMTVIGNKEID